MRAHRGSKSRHATDRSNRFKSIKMHLRNVCYYALLGTLVVQQAQAAPLFDNFSLLPKSLVGATSALEKLTSLNDFKTSFTGETYLVKGGTEDNPTLVASPRVENWFLSALQQWKAAVDIKWLMQLTRAVTLKDTREQTYLRKT